VPDAGQPDRSWAEIMELNIEPRRVWQGHELADILSHQLAVPLELEMGHRTLGVVEPTSPPDRLHLMTFADVLHNSDPLLQLLRLIKEFAKGHLADSHSLLPKEIASILYFTAIAAALVRNGQRITSRPDQVIAEGIRWTLSLSWIDERTRAVLQEAADKLQAGGNKLGGV